MLERIIGEVFNPKNAEISLALMALAMSFSARVRNEVRKRQDGVCDCCGERVCKLQIHHRRPTCKHGNNEIENAVGLCGSSDNDCHAEADKEALEGIIYPQVHTKDCYYPQGNGLDKDDK